MPRIQNQQYALRIHGFRRVSGGLTATKAQSDVVILRLAGLLPMAVLSHRPAHDRPEPAWEVWVQSADVGIARRFLYSAARCDGCDQVLPDVKRYRARFNGGPLESVAYCDVCAELASDNFNGETDAITREAS